MPLTISMNARPYDRSTHGAGRPLIAGSWLAPLILAAFGLGVTLLFSFVVTLVLDTSFQAPQSGVLHTSFSARTDGTAPYAARPEMTIAPQRPPVSIAPAGAD